MASTTVAVLGAGGIIARAIVRDLAESPEVDRLLLLDLDGEGAAAVARDHGGGRADSAAVDATGAGLAAALGGCQVLVNAASYRVNLDAMDAALAAGCHVIDLGGLFWMTLRQLQRDEEFRRAGLLALVGMGASPGKTNVMALHAVRELEGRCDAPAHVTVAAAGRDPDAHLSEDGPLWIPYALQTLLDELEMAPVVLEEGRPREVAPLTPGEEVDFPEPIGRAATIHTLHSELATFGDSFGCRRAEFLLSLHPLLECRLRALAGAPADRVAQEAARARVPSPRALSAHVVRARGERHTVTVSALTRPMPGWGLGGSIVSTAAPAAAAVRLLLGGELTARGVLPPERCLDPREVMAQLERRGASFHTAVAVEGASHARPPQPVAAEGAR